MTEYSYIYFGLDQSKYFPIYCEYREQITNLLENKLVIQSNLLVDEIEHFMTADISDQFVDNFNSLAIETKIRMNRKYTIYKCVQNIYCDSEDILISMHSEKDYSFPIVLISDKIYV